MVPNWMQPKYYATPGLGNGTMVGAAANPTPTDITDPGSHGGSNQSGIAGIVDPFIAWCSPTAAACQLGHLNHNYNISPIVPPLSDNIDAGNDKPVALQTSNWNGSPGWGDYILDGPPVRPAMGTNALQPTDFGYFMNTNGVGDVGGSIAPNLHHNGTYIPDIYVGLSKFYSLVAAPQQVFVGICYNKSNIQTPFVGNGKGNNKPQYWQDNGYDASVYSTITASSGEMLNTIKYEIDNNRTVLAALQYYSITSILNALSPITTSTENEMQYFTLSAATGGNSLTGETYQYTGEYSTALGHTVLVIGYINKGSQLDISPNKDTDWLIVRDNQYNDNTNPNYPNDTHRNVAIPYNNALGGTTNCWDILFATIFVEPLVQQQNTIYVDGGTTSGSAYYNFYSDEGGTNQLPDPPVLNVNTVYTFKRLGNATSHPFYISDTGYEGGASSDITLTGNGNAENGITGTEELILTFNSGFTSGDILEYYCTAHDNMIKAFTVIGSELNLIGSDIDGYLVSASGEVFNFLAMYHQAKNEFDVSGVTPLKLFTTDLSYGRFDVSINNPPPVTFLQLTGGHDIFTNRQNKNTFNRIILTTEAQGLNYIPITPITTVVAEIFTKLCEKDISNNGTAPQDLSFNLFLNMARTHVKHMMGPDFSGVNTAYIEKDPYDEIYKAVDTSNIVAFHLAVQLAIENMKINLCINGFADNHDPNNHDPNKDKKYRRKLFRHFCRRMHKKWEEHGKNIEDSLNDVENDNEEIEDGAANDTGTHKRPPPGGGGGNGRRTNKRFYRRLHHHFKIKKQQLEANLDISDPVSVKIFIKGIIRLHLSFENIINNGHGHQGNNNDIDNHVGGAYGDVASDPPNKPDYRRHWQ